MKCGAPLSDITAGILAAMGILAAYTHRLKTGQGQWVETSLFEAALERSSTSGVHVSPVFNRRTPTKITGYQGTFSTQIVVADLESLSPLVLALTALPDSQVDGPWWSLRPDNPMYREARLAAIADARRRADDYAAAFGTTVADLVEVSDLNSGFAGVREMRAFAMGKGADDAAFEFQPAVQSVSGQVTVRFSLKTVSL